MSKTCTAPNCENPVFGKGYCKRHQHLRTDKKPAAPKWRAKPRPMSDKLAKARAKYRKECIKFLQARPVCEVPGCEAPATEVHHQQGRENDLLLDKSKWMAICHPHHQYYTEHSREAIELGISISKHKKAS